MNYKKHIIIASLLGVTIFTISLLGIIPLTTNGDSFKGCDWMKEISDNTIVTSLSIPGSHDSGATYSIGDFSGKCQDLTISEQLKVGIRFFDIRLQLRNNKLKVVHGIVDQKLDFSDVLLDFSSFINTYPSEALFVSIKKESEDKSSDISFEEALKLSLFDYLDKWDLSGNIPSTLKESRGKIFLLSRYKDNSIGLNCYDGWLDPDSTQTTNTFDISSSNAHVQDYYKVGDIDNKKTEISNCFEYSSNNSNVLTLNFSSCYFVNYFPIAYAPSTAKLINNWLFDEIDNYTNLGIVVSDFVTSKLTEKIYSRNK